MNWRLIIGVVLVINILGSGFGYYYYQNLLSSSPKWQWFFIPDSPNSTLLFSLALLLILLRRSSSVISALGSVYVMKYGLWTMFVIVYYPYYFLAPERADYYWLIFTLHIGMLIEPILILHTIQKKAMVLIIPLILALLNDYFDYFVGTTPLYSFPLKGLGVTPVFSIISTVILSILVYRLSGNKTISRIWKVRLYNL